MAGRLGSIVDRAVVGVGITVSGFVLITVSWLGVSGRAEVEEQVPWLLLGIAGLIVAIVGGSALALRLTRRATSGLSELEREVAALHARAVTEEATRPALPEQVVVPPDAHTFHRSGCALVAGKDDLTVLTPADARDQDLRPCTLCRPTTHDD